MLRDTSQILWYSSTQDTELNHHLLPWVWAKLADLHLAKKNTAGVMGHYFKRRLLKDDNFCHGVLAHSFTVESLTLGKASCHVMKTPEQLIGRPTGWGTGAHKQPGDWAQSHSSSQMSLGDDCSPKFSYSFTRGPDQDHPAKPLQDPWPQDLWDNKCLLG